MSLNFLDIHTFEKSIIQLDKNNPKLYILSKYYDYYDNYGLLLSRLSIFDDKKRGTVEKDEKKVKEILNILMSSDKLEEKTKKLKELDVTEIEKKAIGSMLGMAIGDAMGARFEFNEVVYGKKELEDMGKGPGGAFCLQPGQWTDDTSMGLCIADSLIMNNGELDEHDIMHRFIAWWKGGYNNAFRYNIENKLSPSHSVGLGGNISLSFYNYTNYYLSKGELANPETEAGDKNTSGNGSIMRNAAIPICFHNNIKLAMENAKKQSLITHQGLEAKECCSLLTYIIVQIFEGKEKDEIFNNLGKFEAETEVESVKCLANHRKEGDSEDRNWDWSVEQYHYSPTRTKKQGGYVGSYAMDNMAMSLNTIYKTDNFRDAMIRAANIRGDSDSVASVVGQIAGALYPLETIPGDWIKAIYKWDHGEIALRGYMLARMPIKPIKPTKEDDKKQEENKEEDDKKQEENKEEDDKKQEESKEEDENRISYIIKK